jgi:hypothetical protein
MASRLAWSRLASKLPQNLRHLSTNGSMDHEPSNSPEFHTFRVFHRPKASSGNLYSSSFNALTWWLLSRLSKILSDLLSTRCSCRLWCGISNCHCRGLSINGYSTGISAMTAYGQIWYIHFKRRT